MAQILKINDQEVQINTDDGNVITVPINNIAYPDPQENDTVKVYKDGKSYIVKKASTPVPTAAPASSSQTHQDSQNGYRKVNKHIFVWVGNFLFGGFGVDRFLRGQIGLGICKLLFGWLTLGIWNLVDWLIALTKAYGSAYSNTEDLTFDANGNYTR